MHYNRASRCSERKSTIVFEFLGGERSQQKNYYKSITNLVFDV